MALLSANDSFSYMTAITDDLVQDHVRFQRFLDRFEIEIAKLAGGDSPNYEILRLLCEYFSLFPDEMHHKKEDLVYDVVFERITGRCEPLHELHTEHIKLSVLVQNFARQVEGVLNDQEIPLELLIGTAKEYIETITRHMRKEEEIFFPQALSLLAADDWKNIHLGIADLCTEERYFDKANQVRKIEATLDEFIN